MPPDEPVIKFTDAAVIEVAFGIVPVPVATDENELVLGVVHEVKLSV